MHRDEDVVAFPSPEVQRDEVSDLTPRPAGLPDVKSSESSAAEAARRCSVATWCYLTLSCGKTTSHLESTQVLSPVAFPT